MLDTRLKMPDSFGVSDDYEYYEYTLDSADAADAGDGSVSSLDWPLFTLINPLTNVAAIKVVECEIPSTWYVINAQNNTFTGVYNAGPLSTVVLPYGTYSGSAFATALQNSLNSVVGWTGFTVNFGGLPPPNVAAGALLPQGKMNIWNANPFTLAFPTDTAASPGPWMGFTPGTKLATLSTGLYRLISDGVALLGGPQYVYLNSATLGPLAQLHLPQGVTAPLQAGGHGPQLARIQANASFGGVIFWRDPDPEKYFGLQNLQNIVKIDLFLTLGNGESSQHPLRLNGANFSVKIAMLTNAADRSKVMAGTAAQARVTGRMSTR